MMFRSVIVRFIVALVALGAGCAQAVDQRSYVSGNFLLNLDNTNCGFLKSVEGGAISAEVINEPAGPSFFVKKHIGQPKYEEFTAQVGFYMPKPLSDWIAQSWKMNGQRKNGSVVALDYNLKTKAQREFTNALIAETTIPACDGSSKEPAYIAIKFAPEFIRSLAGDDSKVSVDANRNKQKVWLPCNFKLTIDGIDCSKVLKIDSFTVKQAIVTDDIGEARDSLQEPGKLEFPDLKITLPELQAQSWFDWHKEFVINSNNDESKEKNGVLSFLEPNTQKELVRVKFFNLGIYKIDFDKAEANADQVKRVTVSIYCERMEFECLTDANLATSDSPATNTTKSDPAASDQQQAQQPNEDCQLGVNYTVGVLNPINITVNSVEYTAERRKVGNEYRRPDVDMKMVVVHYTLQNPSSKTTSVTTSSIDFTLSDSSSVNYQRERYAGIEESGAVVNQTLLPSQSVKCFACFQMPAKGRVAKLFAAAHGETKNQAIYMLEDKVTPLPKLYAEPEDNTGSTRRKVVLGRIGESYQVLDYDIKVDSIEYTTQPISDWVIRKDQQFMLMTVEYTNFTGAGYAVAGKNIEVMDQEGGSYYRMGILGASSLREINPKPDPEATAKFRLAFCVPKDFKPQCINLRGPFRAMVTIDMTGAEPAASGTRRSASLFNRDMQAISN